MSPQVVAMTDHLTVRPLTPEDRRHLLALLATLSPEDRYRRFLTTMPTIPDRVVDALAAVDGVDHLAVGAFDGDRCVAIGRAVRFPGRPGAAEVAATVSAGYRRRGLATRLLRELAEPALASGIERFELLAAADNRPAIALAKSLGFRLGFDGGHVTGSLAVRDLAAARPLVAA